MSAEDAAAIPRPRSADIGGLALAVRGEGSGAGWGGWDRAQLQNTSFAEILGAMHTETNRVLDLPVSLPWQVQPSPARHAELVNSLDSWEFAPWTLTDSEVLYCAELLFEALLRIDGLAHDVGGVTVTQLRPFLRQLSSIYRPANQYHNFRHALDVLQSTFTFLGRVNLVPTLHELARLPRGKFWQRKQTGNLLDRTLGNIDLFVLFLVAIGHDVGHPGLSNMFLKNADTPLSTLYGGNSPLERMHIFFLTQLMRRHGMGGLLVQAGGTQASNTRSLLTQTLLVTDLRVHFEWMQRFSRLKDPKQVELIPEHERRVLLCQAFLKASDISNPLRPSNLSEHWSDVLHEEWTSQAGLEIYLDQPVSMAAAAGDDRRKADAQIGFVDTFVKPLFSVLSEVVPEMQEFATYCAENRTQWVARSSAAQTQSVAPTATTASPSASAPNSSALTKPASPEPEVDPLTFNAWFRSVFPLSLPPHLLETDLRTGSLVPSTAGTTQLAASPALSFVSDATGLSVGVISPTAFTHNEKRLSISGVLDLDPNPKFPNPASFHAARAGKRSSVPGLSALLGGRGSFVGSAGGSGASSLMHSPALMPTTLGLSNAHTSAHVQPQYLPPPPPLQLHPQSTPTTNQTLGTNGYNFPPDSPLGSALGLDASGRPSLASWRTGSFASIRRDSLGGGYNSTGTDGEFLSTDGEDLTAGAGGRFSGLGPNAGKYNFGRSFSSSTRSSIASMVPLGSTSSKTPLVDAVSLAQGPAPGQGRVGRAAGTGTGTRNGVMVVRSAFRAACRVPKSPITPPPGTTAGGWVRSGTTG